MENKSEQLTPNSELASIENISKSAERQREALERSGEKEPTIENTEASTERAKIEALENAVSIEGGSAERTAQPSSSAPAIKRSGPLSTIQLDESFDETMELVRQDMKAPARTFSRFIHTKPVEKVSEALGSTVARPNAILTGAITAFIVMLTVYLIARHYGYQLSGFETILAFAAGWLIGIIFDYFRILITGKVAK